MSCNIKINKKESFYVSNRLMDRLHEKLVNLIIKNKLGSNKPIVKFVFELDQSFHGLGVSVDIVDLFSDPKDLKLLIKLIDESTTEIFKNIEPKNQTGRLYQTEIKNHLKEFKQELEKYLKKLI